MRYEEYRGRSAGFTLLELLIVSSLTVFIGLAVFSAFSRGLAVYEWLERGQPGSEASFFFERVAEDLRNLHVFPEKGFLGSHEGMVFHITRPDFLISGADNVPTEAGPVEKVQYVYYGQRGMIRRYVFRYKETEPRYGVTVMEDVENVDFKYLIFRGESSTEPRELDEIEEVPHAVKMEIHVASRQGEDFSRIFGIPIRGR